jgi:hypothetical protein
MNTKMKPLVNVASSKEGHIYEVDSANLAAIEVDGYHRLAPTFHFRSSKSQTPSHFLFSEQDNFEALAGRLSKAAGNTFLGVKGIARQSINAKEAEYAVDATAVVYAREKGQVSGELGVAGLGHLDSVRPSNPGVSRWRVFLNAMKASENLVQLTGELDGARADLVIDPTAVNRVSLWHPYRSASFFFDKVPGLSSVDLGLDPAAGEEFVAQKMPGMTKLRLREGEDMFVRAASVTGAVQEQDDLLRLYFGGAAKGHDPFHLCRFQSPQDLKQGQTAINAARARQTLG